MPASPHVRYECTPQTFRANTRAPVRWLDWDRDYVLAQAMWPDTSPLTLATWREACEQGYCYCAAIERGGIQSIAAVWRYSETAWEVAAVRTRPEARRRTQLPRQCRVTSVVSRRASDPPRASRGDAPRRAVPQDVTGIPSGADRERS